MVEKLDNNEVKENKEQFISKVKLSDGEVYNTKDKFLREQIEKIFGIKNKK